MKKKRIIQDNDRVLPLRYNEERDAYHRSLFAEPAKFSWLAKHSSSQYYIKDTDIGEYKIGSLHGGKEPNALKIKVECPYHQFRLLEPVDSETLFCEDCAPHRYVKNGQIKSKVFHFRNGYISYSVRPEDEPKG